MCDGDDCCKSFAKFILIVVNILFLLLGLLMLGFGIAMVVAPEKVAESVLSGVDLKILGDGKTSYAIVGAGIFMIVMGGIVAIIGAFGFFGACCENRVLLVLYLIIVIIILLAEVALIIFAAVFPTAFENTVKDEVIKTLINNYTEDLKINGSSVVLGGSNDFGYSWAVTQLGEKCCGLNNASDYKNKNYTDAQKTVTINNQPQKLVYPLSCCKLNDNVKFPPTKTSDFTDLNGCFNGNPGTYNDQGCYSAIKKTIEQAAKIAIGIAAAIVGLEIIIIIFGFVLCCILQKSKSLTV